LSAEVQRKRLGTRLRSLRNAKRLTLDDVAEKAGFTGKYLSEVERGKRSLPFATLVAIVENGLGTTLESVFTDLPGGRRRAGLEPEPLPNAVLDAAHKIAELPTPKRARVLAALREVLALAHEK
jgi:transcriptional regulator with XRE-family HTH domain